MRALLALLWLLWAVAETCAWERPSLTDTLGMAKVGVVKIIVSSPNNAGNYTLDFGSGFVVTPSGHVVTVNHLFPTDTSQSVIQGRIAYLLNDDDSQRDSLSELHLIYRDPGNDTALLKFDRPPIGMRPLRVNSTAPVIGETIYVLGFPGGQNLDTSYQATYQGPTSEKSFQFQGISNYGNSGGPIINTDGDVIGIVKSSLDTKNSVVIRNTYFGIPTSVLPIPKNFAPETVRPFFSSNNTSDYDVNTTSLWPQSRVNAFLTSFNSGPQKQLCGISLPVTWNGLRKPETGFLITAPKEQTGVDFQFEFVVRKKEDYEFDMEQRANSPRYARIPYGLIPRSNQSILLLRANTGRSDSERSEIIPMRYVRTENTSFIFAYLPRYFGQLDFHPDGADTAFLLCEANGLFPQSLLFAVCEPLLARAMEGYFEPDNPCLPGKSSAR
jgi:Trypsin-like peptidase domain